MPATSIRCTNGTCRLRVVFDMPCQLSRRHIANAGSRNRLHAFQANAAIIFSNGEDTPLLSPRRGGTAHILLYWQLYGMLHRRWGFRHALLVLKPLPIFAFTDIAYSQ